MMNPPFKVMFIHGIGFHEKDDVLRRWSSDWSEAIRTSCRDQGIEFPFRNPLGPDGNPGEGGDAQADPGILYYEDVIASHPRPTGREYASAVSSLVASYIATKVGGFFSRDRGVFDLPPEVKWKIDQVAAWTVNDALREELRDTVVDQIREKDPDIVIAHSYGGMIAYDAFLNKDADLFENRYFITLGTQVGNPVLRREFGGRQIAVNCKHWFNLYNPKDRVFVASLDHIKADNFTQLTYDHGNGHDGKSYLGHPTVASQVWGVIAETELRLGAGTRSLSQIRASRKTGVAASRAPVSRALLVGVDKYQSPEIPTLQGCVNDTFQLSAALQDAGFHPKNIRILHNARATRENLLEQLRWLLDDVRPGDHRFFSFSGHGHRMASYDLNGMATELEEILCTHDYAFTSDTGLRDRDFMDLYAHLPIGAHFMIFLDCCHSGGITRAGGPSVRSFTGPSDVEHEYMEWDASIQMWKQTGLAGASGLNEKFLPPSSSYKHIDARTRKARTRQDLEHEHQLYYGTHGDTRRIGRATPLRDLPHDKYDRITAHLRQIHGKKVPGGPYLPMVFMACGEEETASEYLHGSISFGAYTYAMAQTLRDFQGSTRARTYQELHDAATRKLTSLGYTQTPAVLAHPTQLASAAPVRSHASAPGRSTARKPAKSAKRTRKP